MAVEVSSSLTQHTIVVCVEKRERGIAMESLLTKSGFRVITSTGLYDALKFIGQEMPHLVISETSLVDGTAINLYDRLQQTASLKKTPMMIFLQKKTKEEVQVLTQRKFSGFFLGPLEPQSFLAKVQEIIKKVAGVSPYFVAMDELGVNGETLLAIEANVLGRSGDQLVSRSASEVDVAASMVCIPSIAEYGPAVLKMASNVRHGDDVYNLFPINRIVGAGRKWIMGLPEIKVGETSDKAEARRILFYDPNEARIESFREILKGYDIELIGARTLNAAAGVLKKETEGVQAVYLHEMLNDATATEWKTVYGKLPASRRPPLIIGTTSMAQCASSGMRYIKRPFGMGLLVEMIQVSFEKGETLANSAQNGPIGGVPVKYQASAQLIGLDESGGVIQVKFPILKGSRLSLTHELLQRSWDGAATVSVTATAPSVGSSGIWHARFEAVSAGMSKAKYWEKISKHSAAANPAA